MGVQTMNRETLMAAFKGKTVKASCRRKDDDEGITFTVQITNAVPAGFSLEEVADAAMHGAASVKASGDDRGVTLSLTNKLTGAAARSHVLAMGETVPAEALPDAPKPERKPRKPQIADEPAAK
jgi:hypothetical protein